MADPYAQFADPVAPQTASDPYAAFAVPAAPQAPLIDPSMPRSEVRAKLASLPEPERKAALKSWADAKVKADSEKENSTTLGRMANTDNSRQMLRGSIGGMGTWLDEINAGIQAGAHSISGGKLGAPYEEAKALEDAKNRMLDANETKLFNIPGVDRVLGEGAGDVSTGTLKKVAGGIMTAPITPLMRGGQAASLGGQVAQGVAAGALYGAGAGAGEGNTIDERAGNAAVGAMVGPVVGGAAPIAGRVASNAAGYVLNKGRPIPQQLSGYNPDSVRSVARAAEADNVGAPKVPLMPETTMADLGPNLRLQAQGIYSQQGPGRTVIANTLEPRREGAAARISQGADAALGPAQNLVELERNVMAAQNAKAAPFRAAYENSTIPMTPKLAQVIERAQASGAMKEAQRLIDIEGPPKTEAAFYDYVKRGLDSLSEGAQGPHGRATTLSRAYGNLARDLRETIDDILVPGSPSSAKDIVAHFKAGGTPDQVSPYAMARYHSGEGLQFREALEEGGKTFSKGVHPDQFSADVAAMAPSEYLGTVYGARGQVRDTIGDAASAMRQNGDVRALQQLGSPYARQKLETITSPDRAKALTDRLDAESQMGHTYNKVMAGPETAERLAAQKEFPQTPDIDKTPRVLTGVTIPGALAQGVYNIIDALRAGALTQKNIQIAHDAAKMLMAQGGDREVIRQALLQYAASKALTAPQQRAVEYVVAALGRSAIEPASPNIRSR